MTDLLWMLIAVQAVMGFIDIVVHHEFLARLTWQADAATELTLHGVRNLLYTAFYLLVGWYQPMGAWVLLLYLVLATELAITLWDWLEEDRSRRLPASERVLHALLTLNFGAILANLLPVLEAWRAATTGFAPADAGLWSAAALLFGTVAALLGAKDLLAARRLERWRARADAPSELAAGLPEDSSVLITGATGLIGSRLTAALIDAGHTVTVLARDPARAAALGTPIRIVRSLDEIRADARIDAIVHLAGASIAGGLWTEARKRLLLHSRLGITEAIGRLLRRLARPPAVWINASAIGWYAFGPGDRGPMTEATGEPGTGFAHTLCAEVEAAAESAAVPGTRVVNLRFGLVLSRARGFLAQLLPAIDLGVGTVLGSGRQRQSWIHLDDAVRAIVFSMNHDQLRGAINATAPEATTAATLTRGIARRLHRPAVLRVPSAILRVAASALATELLLASQSVVPARLLNAGFEHRYPELGAALDRELT